VKPFVFASIGLLWCSSSLALSLDDLQVGHWVEARGSMVKEHMFDAQKLKVTDPRDEVGLIGTLRVDDQGRDRLLGFRLDYASDVKHRELTPGQLKGRRVKVEGEWLGSDLISVDKVSSRGAGRDRLAGPLEIVRTKGIRNYFILGIEILPSSTLSLTTQDARDLASFALQTISIGDPVELDIDDDDQFGEGILLTAGLRLTSRLEFGTSREDNFNFDRADNEDREDARASMRARLDWSPSNRLFGVAELRAGHNRRNRRDRGRSAQTDLELGETYLQYRLSQRMSLSAGRQDFDDSREWLFDSNLDALRLAFAGERIRAETSVSKRIDNDGSREEAATNLMLYVSNASDQRHFAAYLIDRNFSGDLQEHSRHIGLRVFRRWSDETRLWLELARQSGRRERNSIKAWAFDAGGTWFVAEDERLYLTASLAFASGDDPATQQREDFRQTGLQDNNGKLGGITSFKYYGELSNPELSNLWVSTLGIGSRLTPDLSIDLVGHSYQLHRRATEIADADWDADLTGSSNFLGWEVDAILGLRHQDRWSLEGVVGYFAPGAAFEDRNASFFGKLQVRLRF